MTIFRVSKDHAKHFLHKKSWSFDKALEIAQDGDTLELEKGYSFSADKITINKSIKITGITYKNKRTTYYPTLSAEVIIGTGASVSLENIFINAKIGKTALYINNYAKLKASNTIIQFREAVQSKIDEVIYAGENSFLELQNSMVIHLPASGSDNSLAVLTYGDSNFIRSTIQGGMHLENGHYQFDHCIINNPYGNVLLTLNANVKMEATKIQGGMDNSRCVYSENSRLNFADTNITGSSALSSPVFEAKSGDIIFNKSIIDTSDKQKNAAIKIADSDSINFLGSVFLLPIELSHCDFSIVICTIDTLQKVSLTINNSKGDISYRTHISGGCFQAGIPCLSCINSEINFDMVTVGDSVNDGSLFCRNSQCTVKEFTAAAGQILDNSSANIIDTAYFIRCLSVERGSHLSGESAVISGNTAKYLFEATDNSVIDLNNMILGMPTSCPVEKDNSVQFNVKNLTYAKYNKKRKSFKRNENGSYIFVKKNVPIHTIDKKFESPKIVSQEKGLQKLDEMIGLKEVKEQVRKFIAMVEYNRQRKAIGLPANSITLHSLFLGNPGTGKTAVARMLGRILYENGVLEKDIFVEVTASDLISCYIGETAEVTHKKLESALGGILFIDEAYSLYSKTSGANYGTEAVNEILKYMEDHRDQIMIIFAGYRKEMNDFLSMNPGLESRIPNRFYFEDYTPEEIAEIGMQMLTSQWYTIADPDYYVKHVKEAYIISLEHSNARWIRNINEKIIQQVAEDYHKNKSTSLTEISNHEIQLALDHSNGASMSDTDKMADYRKQIDKLNSMVGLTNVKQRVKEIADQAMVAKALGETSGKTVYHMIFSGDPGTGKTTVARIVARIFYDLGLMPRDTVYETDRSEMVGEYIGQTEKNVRRIVKNAMGGVLFIDEAYQLANRCENDFGKNAVETLVKALSDDGTKFVAIFAGYTDRMNEFLAINQGLKSRIPYTIEFESYTPEEVAQIVSLKLKVESYTFNEELLKGIVAEKYRNLPKEEKSNGRWAQNFVQKLLTQQTSYLAELLVSGNDAEVRKQVRIIGDDTIRKMISMQI